MNDKPKDIKTIFAEAIEKHAGQERAAYLDEACGEDTQLRRRVEDLLKSELAGSRPAIPHLLGQQPFPCQTPVD